MVVVKSQGENLLVCFENSMYLYDITSKSTTKIEIPEYMPDASSKEDKEAKIITSLAVSKNFVGVIKYKQLVIFNKNLEVVKNYTLKRAANAVTFTVDDNVLVADKTGDVYVYSIADEAPKFVLGHLSMLLDLKVSKDGRFLLTCDRDEKIRVSRFPNTYNIQSFCLGHAECITGLEILDEKRMISCSGDGFLIVWGFLTGEVLCRVNTNENLESGDLVDRFCKKMSENKCEATCLPVMKMQVLKTDGFYYVVVEIYDSKLLQVYKIELGNDYVKFDFVQSLSVGTAVKSFSLTERLFVFCENDVKLFKFSNGKFVEDSCENLKKFYLENKDLTSRDEFDISTYFKRKFHNVEEYLEKKRQRIEKKK